MPRIDRGLGPLRPISYTASEIMARRIVDRLSKKVAGHIAFVLPSNKRSARAILRAAKRIVDAGKHGPFRDGSDYKDHRCNVLAEIGGRRPHPSRAASTPSIL
jgi:hypothetical protein